MIYLQTNFSVKPLSRRRQHVLNTQEVAFLVIYRNFSVKAELFYAVHFTGPTGQNLPNQTLQPGAGFPQENFNPQSSSQPTPTQSTLFSSQSNHLQPLCHNLSPTIEESSTDYSVEYGRSFVLEMSRNSKDFSRESLVNLLGC